MSSKLEHNIKNIIPGDHVTCKVNYLKGVTGNVW